MSTPFTRDRALAELAPGTLLRQAVENILSAGLGALIVVGADDEIEPLIDGGFHLDCPFSVARLYELCKMDGAVLVSEGSTHIRYANVQLQPDASLPTSETGTRHRTAERVARQTGALVISVSQRRRSISVFAGDWRHVLHDPMMLLARANQALATLGEQRGRLDDALFLLNALEFRDKVAGTDVVRVLQRFGLMARVTSEISQVATELGAEGGLVGVQLAHHTEGVAETELLVIRDYLRPLEAPLPTWSDALQVAEHLKQRGRENRLDAVEAGRLLGLGNVASDFESPVQARGLRQLDRVPQLPTTVAERLVTQFGTLGRLMAADIPELDAVQGVGESRARSIKQALARLRATAIGRRHVP